MNVLRSDTSNPAFARDKRWGTPNTAAVSIPSELSFENVSHSIEDTPIVQDVSLVAKSGTVTCLLGPSGSGKTTLLRIAAGMFRQSAGRILLDKQEIGGPNVFLPPEERGIGLVFQDYALFPHLTILKNVKFGLSHLKRRDRTSQAMQMLERVGLDQRINDYPHELSGGEQQRVALARAMVQRPGVLLMDEPFSGLDSRLRDYVREETLGVLRETHATSVIVTHDPEEALKMGDQIVLLNNGRVEQIGTGRDLYFKPATLFAAGFFSEISTFEGRVKAGQVDTPVGRIACDKALDGEMAVIAIRANAVRVFEKEIGEVTSAAEGRILSVRFIGEHDHVTIGVQGADEPLRLRIKTSLLGESALAGRTAVYLKPQPTGTFAFPKN